MAHPKDKGAPKRRINSILFEWGNTELHNSGRVIAEEMFHRYYRKFEALGLSPEELYELKDVIARAAGDYVKAKLGDGDIADRGELG